MKVIYKGEEWEQVNEIVGCVIIRREKEILCVPANKVEEKKIAKRTKSVPRNKD